MFGKYKSGEVKDGIEILGFLTTQKNYTLGLLNWP